MIEKVFFLCVCVCTVKCPLNVPMCRKLDAMMAPQMTKLASDIKEQHYQRAPPQRLKNILFCPEMLMYKCIESLDLININTEIVVYHQHFSSEVMDSLRYD